MASKFDRAHIGYKLTQSIVFYEILANLDAQTQTWTPPSKFTLLFQVKISIRTPLLNLFERYLYSHSNASPHCNLKHNISALIAYKARILPFGAKHS
tara:strand:- start:3975 stop:4265 length:291 start_codon:yes stop_codon:yes gene_type:complete